MCTDLGSRIGNFDCGYSTVWKFSHFSTTLILREINFGWYHFWGFQWPKWISCNIGVAEKWLNFHTVEYSQSKFPIKIPMSVFSKRKIYNCNLHDWCDPSTTLIIIFMSSVHFQYNFFSKQKKNIWHLLQIGFGWSQPEANMRLPLLFRKMVYRRKVLSGELSSK